jgi:hypothetical protein
MKAKVIATIMALGMVLTAFSLLAVADNEQPQPTGVAHTIANQVYDAPGARYTLVGTDALPNTADDQANGLSFDWDVTQGAGVWNPNIAGTTVVIVGWPHPYNTELVQMPGTWRNRSDLGAPWRSRLNVDAGSPWDTWAAGDYCVQFNEVFNTNTTGNRNYTATYEQVLTAAGTDNVGQTVYLEPIHTPVIASSAGNSITIRCTPMVAPNGIEVASLDDGYQVYKSTTGIITPVNPGVVLGDMTLNAGNWEYTDAAWTVNSWYAVKVKWEGGSTPFAARYSLGKSQSLSAPKAAATATVTNVVPASPSNDNTPAFTYTTTGGPTSVDIFYATAPAGPYVLWGNDATPGDFTWTPAAGIPDGTYYFAAIGNPGEVPTPPVASEYGPYIIDTLAPTITLSSPADGATGWPVAAGSNWYVFSENMNNLITGFTTNMPGAAPPLVWAVNQTMATIAHGALVAETNYWVDFSAQGHADDATNPLGGDMYKTFGTVGVPPDTTGLYMNPTTYNGVLPDDAVMTVYGNDNTTGGSTVNTCEWRVDINDDADYGDPGEGWNVLPPLTAAASWRAFRGTVDLHNWSLTDPNVQARVSDAAGADATPVQITYTVDDAVQGPQVAYVAPTPANGANVPPATYTIRLTAQDFRDVRTTGYYRITAKHGATTFFAENTSMTFMGWAMGSNIDTFQYPIAATTGGWRVDYWTYMQDGTTVTSTYRFFNTQNGTTPTNPLNIGGFITLYNGNLATGYNPGYVEFATVTVRTYSAAGVYTTIVDTTDALGFYQVTFTNNSYMDGGTVWVNTTTPASPTNIWVGAVNYPRNAPGWINNSLVTAVDAAGQLFRNETLGIPTNLTVRWVPDWTVLPIPGINVLNAGATFYVTAVARDRQGLLAPGYYGALTTWTNQTVGTYWGAVLPAQATATLDGLGGAVSPFPDANLVGTDGYWNNTAVFFTMGIWVCWVNDTTAPINSMTPNAPAPLPPQVPAINERDNTHVRILGGGFFWQPVRGWNIISVTKNTIAVYGATFTASEAGACVIAGALRNGVVLTGALLSNRLAGSPANYETWDILAAGGVNFVMDIDHAYWLYVNANILDVFVQSDDILGGAAGDPPMGIAPGGLNTVGLVAGWNMVNSGLNQTGTVFGAGANAPIHTDVSGNVGNWAAGTVLYTAGAWTAGPPAYRAWYDAPLTGGHRADAQGAGAGVGYATATTLFRCANTWNPALQVFFTGVAYADWVGQWNFGSAYNNQGSPIYYASGFWIYAEAAGTATYDISS